MFMAEGFPKKEKLISQIEKQANYEGNHALLLFERISNPIIRKRMMDDLYTHFTSADDPEYNTYLSREEFEKDIEEKIEIAKHHTNIEYPEKPDIDVGGRQDKGVGILFLNSINLDTGEKYDVHSMNITEAHEKGHEIRDFSDFESDFSRKILSAFDSEKVIPSKVYIDFAARILKDNGSFEEYKTEKDIASLIKKYLFTPKELYERMSQLKNYFGMKGDEVFTKEYWN